MIPRLHRTVRIAAIHAVAGSIDIACLIFACRESSMALLLPIAREDHDGPRAKRGCSPEEQGT